VTLPVRAHHVGSLLRPASLRAAYRRHRRGEIGDHEFREAQDEAIRDAVAMQEHLGLRVVTDGELRRTSYWSAFVAAVDGLEVDTSRFKFTYGTGDRLAFAAPHATGALRRWGAIAGAELDFLTEVASPASSRPKVTLPSPSTLQFGHGPVPRRYSSPQDFFTELAGIYRAEIADLAARGATLVQLDEAALAMLCDPSVRRRVEAAGEVPGQLVDDYVAAIAAAGAERPAGVALALHVCRGNFKGRWMASGGYEPVAEALFGGSGADMLLLEFDSARAGGFEPLRHVPATLSVVLGLISSKTPELECRDELLRRIEEACRYVDVERLALSPQCGFASTAGGNPLSEDDQRRKLALVVDVCNEVWGGP
jgi:5-methyltetrahydropteroyltriglutamate--homocysteine methyltransferase